MPEKRILTEHQNGGILNKQKSRGRLQMINNHGE